VPLTVTNDDDDASLDVIVGVVVVCVVNALIEFCGAPAFGHRTD